MCCKWAAPLIAKSGGVAIVNTNTMSAHFGIAGMSAYLWAKYAFVEFTTILALELAPDNTRVKAFSPGMTLTPALPSRYEQTAAEQPKHISTEHLRPTAPTLTPGSTADPDARAAVARCL